MDWFEFYSNIRGSDWPDCSKFGDIKNLPIEFQLEILNHHLSYLFEYKTPSKTPFTEDSNKSTTMLDHVARTSEEVVQMCQSLEIDYFLDNSELPLSSKVVCQGIEINYHPLMECGGIRRAPMFIDTLELIAPGRIFDHGLEWCSGPGFIGFSLLGKGLCKKLDLADIWKPSLLAAKGVNAVNNVTTWHIRRLSDIQPPQKYDLIVGNPPWYPGNLLHKYRLTCDPGLTILKNFLIDAKNYLTPDGLIVLVEGQTHTGPKDILSVLSGTGLQLTQILTCQDDWHWFVGIEHNRDFEDRKKV
jgi:hypothetical protein